MGIFSSRKKRSSKDAAKDRLQVLLAIDRNKNNDRRIDAIIVGRRRERAAALQRREDDAPLDFIGALLAYEHLIMGT